MADDIRSSSLRSPAPPVAIHGVPFDNLTRVEAADAILQLIEARVPQYVLCADSGFLLRSRDEAGLRRGFSEACLVLCASRSLLFASRLSGNALPEHIDAGVLCRHLLDAAELKKLKICLLGTADVSPTSRSHPELSLEGVPFQPRVAADGGRDALAAVKAVQPDLVLFSTSEPDLPEWTALHRHELGVPVCLGFPGPFRGTLPGTPGLAGRCFDAVRLVWSLLPQLWRLRASGRTPARRSVSAPVQAEIDWRSIKLPERLNLETVNNDVLLLDQLLADGRHCLLDMSGVRFIDSTGLGHLVRLHKRIRSTGRQLVLLAPSEATLRTLKLVQLQDFFALARTEAAAHALIDTRVKEEPGAAASSLGDVESLLWRGEVTAANAGAVWETTSAHIRSVTPAAGLLELDLRQLRFVDSSGLSVMVCARKLALERGLRLRFCCPQPMVRDTLQRAGLAEYLLGEGG